MRSTPTTPYSDFMFLLDKAIRGTQDCIVRGEYNTIIGAYKDYVGKENADRLFDINSSTWYYGTFGQVSSWEVYIITANVNDEFTDGNPVIVIDGFFHRRKFIVVIDRAIIDCCYFAGNNIKDYSDSEKRSMLTIAYKGIENVIYLFVENVVMEGNKSTDQRFVNRNMSIANHLTAWYIYNNARVGKDIIRDINKTSVAVNIEYIGLYDKMTDEDFYSIADHDIKQMEYEGIFNGSFPDIDKLEGGSFRYFLDDPLKKIMKKKNIDSTQADPGVQAIIDMVHNAVNKSKDQEKKKDADEYQVEEDLVKTEELLEEVKNSENPPRKPATRKKPSTSKKATSSKTSKKKEDAKEDGAKD